jgi:8-oxo-dGTP pyrophosphatase MutT (NUDIX family)
MKFPIRKAVMAVIVDDDYRILIGSSPRDGGYKFPQGGLEPNEDIITGIKRELEEELALKINDTDIIQSYSKKVSYKYPNEDRYIFLSQELSIVKIQYKKEMQLMPQDEEFEKLLWISPYDLHKYNTYFRAKAYTMALKICGLL